MKWLVRQDEDILAEVTATRRRHRVDIRFPRFRSLRGRVWNHCLAIYANDRGTNYDRIFDADCLPIRLDGSNAFECGLCEGERETFANREALFENHLFDPFGEWVHTKLIPAKAVEYQRIGYGFTTAKLVTTDENNRNQERDLYGIDHLRFYRRADALQ